MKHPKCWATCCYDCIHRRKGNHCKAEDMLASCWQKRKGVRGCVGEADMGVCRRFKRKPKAKGR
jgi:hypothetical protein